MLSRNPWRACSYDSRRIQNHKAAIDNTGGNRQRTKWREKVKLGHNNNKKKSLSFRGVILILFGLTGLSSGSTGPRSGELRLKYEVRRGELSRMCVRACVRASVFPDSLTVAASAESRRKVILMNRSHDCNLSPSMSGRRMTSSPPFSDVHSGSHVLTLENTEKCREPGG